MIHVLEAFLTGAALFVVPLAFVAVMGAVMALFDRFLCFLHMHHKVATTTVRTHQSRHHLVAQ